MLQEYISFLKINELKIIENRFTVDDPHYGVVDLAWKGNLIWGIYGLDDAEMRSEYLELTNKNIKGSK